MRQGPRSVAHSSSRAEGKRSLMSDVIVVGGGPTGLMLAGELALAGVDVAILERRPTAELAGSRAGGFHARTIEILDQRGIADRFLAEGQTAQVLTFGTTMLDLDGFPTRHPYSLGLFQNHIERILRGWVEELGVPIRRGRRGHRPRAGRRRRRRTAGRRRVAPYDVPGRRRRRAQRGPQVGRHRLRRLGGDAEQPDRRGRGRPRRRRSGVRHDATGIHGLHVLEDGRTVRVVLTERELGPAVEPTLADLSEALKTVYGTDFGVHSPTWISRFTDATRQAASYRERRVLLAGDAAHIHHPAGGQGIGLGVQDAVNLGWKLAQVIRGRIGRRAPRHLPGRAPPGGGSRIEVHRCRSRSSSDPTNGSRR